MANYSTPSRVQQVIRAGDEVERIRGDNRTKINHAANCFPPLSEDEAKKMGLKINVEFGQLMDALANARRQYRGAWRSDEHFFKVKLPKAPPDHQAEWELVITEAINGYLSDSLPYFELDENTIAAVVTHGIGPRVWYGPDDWLSEFVAVGDLRIPTDTTLDFKNLDWFSVRQRYTPLSLLDEVFEKSPRGWNKKAVRDILRNYKELNVTDAVNNYDIETSVEALHNLLKQNGGMVGGDDAIPTIPLWHFYFKDKGKWFMRIVPEQGAVKSAPNTDEQFLWTSEEPIADKLEHILHCQFGDLNNDAKFTYHAIRSLGFALLEPCFYTNLTQCKLLQHVLDQFNIWLRSSDPVDRARASIQEFQNLKVLRQGLGVVPSTERHQVDHEVVEMALNETKQLVQSASSTYTQKTDTGTRKEQTAFETNVKVQQVNAMTSGLLLKSFIYRKQEFREICRRFCRQESSNEDVKSFWETCREAGIPTVWLDVKLWKIEPVTPLGMGNPTVALSMAKQLLEILPIFDPTAQQEIKHEVVCILTQDPRKAARWAPLGKNRGVTDAQRDSQSIFATLMQGIPLPPKEGMATAEQAETMLGMMAIKVKKLQARDNMATADEAEGLITVAQYIGALLQPMSGDPQRKDIAKKYGDVLGKLMNEVKGMFQRWQEQEAKKNANGHDPAMMAKIQSMMMVAQAKIKAKEMADRQKMQQADHKFVREQRREDAKTFKDLERQDLTTQADIKNKGRMASLKE